MLHFLIAENKPAPDFRAGSNIVMGGASFKINGSNFI